MLMYEYDGLTAWILLIGWGFKLFVIYPYSAEFLKIY